MVGATSILSPCLFVQVQNLAVSRPCHQTRRLDLEFLICSTLALQAMHLCARQEHCISPLYESECATLQLLFSQLRLIRRCFSSPQPWFGSQLSYTLTGAVIRPLTTHCQSLLQAHITSIMPSIKSEQERKSSSSSKKRHGGRSSDSSIMSTMSDANIHNFAPVARIMKTALPDNAKIAKEAKECMQECVSEFISFITSEGSLSISLASLQRRESLTDVAQHPRNVNRRSARRSMGRIFSSP
jgi:hypothetical protein